MGVGAECQHRLVRGVVEWMRLDTTPRREVSDSGQGYHRQQQRHPLLVVVLVVVLAEVGLGVVTTALGGQQKT